MNEHEPHKSSTRGSFRTSSYIKTTKREEEMNMARIYKRGNVYWIQYYRGGKYYRESSGSDKLSDAKKIAKMREGEMAQGKMLNLKVEKTIFDEISAFPRSFTTRSLTDVRVYGPTTSLRNSTRIQKSHQGQALNACP
jgi:hypothetical protein